MMTGTIALDSCMHLFTHWVIHCVVAIGFCVYKMFVVHCSSGRKNLVVPIGCWVRRQILAYEKKTLKDFPYKICLSCKSRVHRLDWRESLAAWLSMANNTNSNSNNDNSDSDNKPARSWQDNRAICGSSNRLFNCLWAPSFVCSLAWR